ncbi:HugZ family protein [Chelatococcus daeguensis]|uniref:HugZ family pyridoxamine 5'-phosphate oxidase n=1 Tax=Chelatococcus daeguensis TaxID=444444 RepID=UPI0007AB9867|nr:DUF2470 domain-containing protein [Chelatococcus daeguensis]KZE34728.1 pyridoxamine 5'-phosphate oxidase [Chelatococcus daeguensis]MBM3082574.1 HugZ family protein [Chelatococcus daeguensis]
MSAAADSTAAFDPRSAAAHLLRRARFGALGTLAADGAPYVSLVNVATAIDGTPVTLISTLALHTQNIARDARVSLLLTQVGAGDPSAHPRISLAGRAVASDDEALKRRFLARHPLSAGYAGFKDFAFYRIEITGAHLVAGFGRIVDLAPQDLVDDLAGAEHLVENEAGAVAHMNEDHADALALYATKLLGLPEGNWRASGIDRRGLDLVCGDLTGRLDFPAPIGAPGELRHVLKDLAAEARRR